MTDRLDIGEDNGNPGAGDYGTDRVVFIGGAFARSS